MHTLKVTIGVVWLIFWVGWLAAAVGAKERASSPRGRPGRGIIVVVAVLLFVGFRGGGLAVRSPALGAVGATLFAAGLALAIWARVALGRNWGMPMTVQAEPELVTSGPYRLVRHPIYSGLLVGLIGSALATNLVALIVVAIAGAYFYYCASIEEQNLVAMFPAAYPAYRAATKMLIPFVL